MKLSVIAAIARNDVIGRDGALPWHLPADLARFKQLTTGHMIVMGRNTWESIGRPLPKRRNVVLSGTLAEASGASIVASLDAALDAARAASETNLYVIGGAGVYAETLPQVKKEWIDTGRAKLVYRDFPTSPVALAVYAAMVARCAPEDRYFSFLEVFFKQQRNWTSSPDPMKALAQLARLGGMSQADFDACTQNQELFQGIRERALDGQMEFEIESTPSFVVNGRVIRGGMSYADFKDVLEGAAK